MNDDQNSNNAQANTQRPEDTRLTAAKRRALEELTPIIGKLDIDAERKFEVCMSAVRLTDNADLIQPALEAALAIKDEGPRAEALISLVSEINYLEQA